MRDWTAWGYHLFYWTPRAHQFKNEPLLYSHILQFG